MTRLTYAEAMVRLMKEQGKTIVPWGDAPLLDECYALVNLKNSQLMPPARWKLVLAGLGRRPDLFSKGRFRGCTWSRGVERVVTSYRLRETS